MRLMRFIVLRVERGRSSRSIGISRLDGLDEMAVLLLTRTVRSWCLTYHAPSGMWRRNRRASTRPCTDNADFRSSVCLFHFIRLLVLTQHGYRMFHN